MLTGRASDIFEINDEPLGDDDRRETAASHADDLEHAGAGSAANAQARTRLLALGCLIAGVGALAAVLPRDGQRPDNAVETHSSAPRQRNAHAHVRATRTPRTGREVRHPGPQRTKSRRVAPMLGKRVVPAQTWAAPSGAAHAVVPLTAGSAPRNARPGALAAPYEEFGFER